MGGEWCRLAHRPFFRDLFPSIRTGYGNRTDNPKPFVWHTNADEILDSVAAYCQRINDSGH